MSARERVTLILQELEEGQEGAASRLLPLVYDELHARAAALFRDQPDGHTLQPTIVVHDAYERLVRASGAGARNRGHFLNIAAQAMRQVLSDHARKRLANKRGGGVARVTLHSNGHASEKRDEDLVALDDALQRLEELDPRRARVLTLRYFTELKLEEIAEVLKIGASTVKRELRGAQAWLRKELENSP